jgi:glutaredoxin
MISIYGNSVCKWCREAKKLAEDYALQYEWIDLDFDENLNRFKVNFPNARSIPQIMWDNRHIGGYDDFLKEIESTIGGYGQGKI